jgi:UDP-N-acetylmuramate--alanine ligase
LQKINGHNVKQAYFVGIGGIGMSAIARYFCEIGIDVWGYDKTPTPLTDKLLQEGVLGISFKDQLDQIPELFIGAPKEESLVIYTPAIPAKNAILNYFISENYEVLKRSLLLGMITQKSFNISIAGTHGKTTTTAMLSHLLNHGDKAFTAFLGGISSNFNSNYFRSRPISEETKYTITEADEYDRSFLKLSPQIAGITSMDADHLDIYGKKESIVSGFNDFASLVPDSGHLFYLASLKENLEQLTCSTNSYGIGEGQIQAQNVRIENGYFIFDLNSESLKINDLRMGLPGLHNIENALLASAIADKIGINANEIRRGLETFKGVKRRFEHIVRGQSKVFIDDYAHHPTELKNIIASVKMLYPNKKILGVFQPHLYSRTRDFMDQFANELSQLDSLILLDIYPAREEPIEGITSEALSHKVSCEKSLVRKEDLVSVVSEKEFDVLLTLGAGDISDLVVPLKDEIKW